MRVVCLILFAALLEAGNDPELEREQWFYGPRAYPHSQLPAGARLQALRQTQQDRRLRPRAPSTGAGPNWTLIGPRPTNLGRPSESSGRVNSIAIDPRDSNTVYIATAEGGVWKTSDGGATWTPLTDSQVSLAGGSVVLDPTNPDTVYVGTGESNFAYDSYFGAGILKSGDGGATWTNLPGPFRRSQVAALAISPDGGVLLAALGTQSQWPGASNGIWRSTDGAVTWQAVLTGAAGTEVAFDPMNPATAWAALGSSRTGGNSKNGIYRSTDSGQTWVAVSGSGAAALPSANVGRIDIALAPSAPGTVYASIQDAASGTYGQLLGIYKTTDGGETWNQLPVSSPMINAYGDQAWYDNIIRVSPQDANVVWAGGVRLLRSLDGGNTWSAPSLTGAGSQIHVDFHALAFTPDGSKLYLGNDGGMYSTTAVTATPASWNNLNDTLALTQFSPGLALDPQNAGFALGGAQDNGTQRYSGSLSWDMVVGGDGGFAAVDSARPLVAYTTSPIESTGSFVFKTLNAAGNLGVFSANYGVDLGDSHLFVPPLAMDPSNPEVLYLGTSRVWQSVDGAGQWTAISRHLSGCSGSGCPVSAVAAAPSDGTVVYAGTADGKVQVTRDALDGPAASWTDRSAGLPGRSITHITVDPVNPLAAYATCSGFAGGAGIPGHIFATADGGATWQDVSANLPDIPVNDLVVDPDIPGALYAATDIGVFGSGDGGVNWSALGNGLPNVVVTSLALHRGQRLLRAATHGRSAWELPLPLAAPSVQPVLTTLSPVSASAGDADFTLTASGANFASGTVLRWNGRPRTTTVVSPAQLAVAIPASDVAQAGLAVVDVLVPAAGAGASNQVGFAIGPPPAATPGAFVSAANPAGGSALAPRGIASLYGSHLAGQTAIASSAPPLPLTLGGVTLTVGGVRAPLFYVSPNQINFQIPLPSGFSGPTPYPLVITEGTLSTTITVTVTPYSPALFTTNAQGTGQAAALIAGTAALAAPEGGFPNSRPARRGEFISLYCTGLGDVRNRPALGSAAPSGPLASTLATPAVTIGGVPATWSFSGLAPGFVGLYQVNVQVPAAAPAGDAVAVALTIGGVASNTATIAVQ